MFLLHLVEDEFGHDVVAGLLAVLLIILLEQGIEASIPLPIHHLLLNHFHKFLCVLSLHGSNFIGFLL